jgi:hypothetical protein
MTVPNSFRLKQLQQLIRCVNKCCPVREMIVPEAEYTFSALDVRPVPSDWLDI